MPAQGPIGVFIHHNTLHAFQDRAFEAAVVEAAAIFGAEPFMTEEAFQAATRCGRIRREDVDAVLRGMPDRDILPGRLTRRQLRVAMLVVGIQEPDPATLTWELEEGRFSGGALGELFDACLQTLPPQPAAPAGAEPEKVSIPDLAEEIHPLLIRLSGAFLDQGMAYWPMPGRERGFYESVRELFSIGGFLPRSGQAGLCAEFRRQKNVALSAEQTVASALHALRIPEAEYGAFIERELLALPGWAGLFNRLEEAPELAEHVHVRVSLMDYLAVRLTMVRAAAQATGFMSSPPAVASIPTQGIELAAARLALAAAVTGLQPADVWALEPRRLKDLREEVESFGPLERRRIYHLAYERRHEREILLPLAAHRQSIAIRRRKARPAAQVFFCLDEREESTRRHLEEVDPEIETWGAAGFFGVAIDYAGIDDAHSVALCPVVVTPQHAVREQPVEGQHHLHVQRLALRRLLARGLRATALSSRGLVRGWIATAALGAFSVLPLLLRVLSPRSYGRLRERLNEIIVPRPRTELCFTRDSEELIEGLAQGFSVREKADRVAGVLAGAGLTGNFSRLVVILGHGSTSLNNPHESAHDCGACGGRRGGPNARLFAAMANRPEVRRELQARGVTILADTWFVGGHHDSASEDIELYDVHQLPETHRADFERVCKAFNKTRALAAHERSRRFEFADPTDTPEQALRHVEERSEHLAEPRPEYGHCTNAVCIVGRREITRGLFLDRRAFLVSYDATKDPGAEYLARQLAAVVPVCAGISLEYYFSFVDNEVYGCGTKLPHNVTGLVGVMNGHASDLRTGQPWQMVEIHEPVRVLFVVETTPERLLKTIDASPLLREVVHNGWLRLSTIDPQTGEIQVFRGGAFERLEGEQPGIPEAASSVEWYRGRMEHLPIARIGNFPEAA